MESMSLRGVRVRERRRAAGLTQAELAERSDVSRQLIAAVEAGENAPAVDAALRIARALGTTVEALFAPPAVSVVPALGGRLPVGKPLRVGRVGNQLVAAELPDHGTAGAGWGRPDAILEAGGLRLFEGPRPAGIVLAGCDPALGVAEAMLPGIGPRSLLAIPTATGIALRALGAGTIHAAVVHGPAGRLPPAPVPVLGLHLARWPVGLAHPRRVSASGLSSLLETGISVVQREEAASSQQAFKRAVAGAGLQTPWGPRAAGHIEAARTAALLDCAAVTTQAAARAFGLSFLALEQHTVEIWVAERWAAHPSFQGLGELLSSAAFTERLSQFSGYELEGCGSVI